MELRVVEASSGEEALPSCKREAGGREQYRDRTTREPSA
jgi:hypothetical protein